MLRHLAFVETLLALALLAAVPVRAAEGAALPAIEKVEIGKNREFAVNGRPFFPIMGFYQDPRNFPLLKEHGMNAIIEYGRPDQLRAELTAAQEAGLYAIIPFLPEAKDHPALLGYVHGDEPDLQKDVSDADVQPVSALRVNSGAPLRALVDGRTNSWTALDPLKDASFAIKLKAPVTIERIGVWLTISGNLAVAKELAFAGDGKEILKAALDPAKKGRQELALPAPATFQTLQVTVTQVEGAGVWGSIGEIEGFDKEGKNVLVSPVRRVPRTGPEETLASYQRIKGEDSSRPIFMTLTARFNPVFKYWNQAQIDALYPEYMKCADVFGTDVYPVYGFGRADWVPLVHDSMVMLRKLAGPKPVYQFIESSVGKGTPSPDQIRAEAWAAICAGATGIAYFTHQFKPQFAEFGVPDENRAAIKELNARITRLAPAILAPPTTRAIALESGGVSVVWKATESNGALTLFAVNHDGAAREAKATFTVPGLKAGSDVVVLDENRTLKAGDGSFTDTFAPLGVHIYRVTW